MEKGEVWFAVALAFALLLPCVMFCVVAIVVAVVCVMLLGVAAADDLLLLLLLASVVAGAVVVVAVVAVVVVGVVFVAAAFVSVVAERPGRAWSSLSSAKNTNYMCYSTHRLHSSSFLGFPYRILNTSHKKELVWSLWVETLTVTVILRLSRSGGLSIRWRFSEVPGLKSPKP